ncbi:hypothetical protein [Comamonas thiooxydans]|uniref:hypothetical protein n=1 Tax=Comamonas thiooxydans TaxID=363952 RepID=UPI00050F48B3|nr:hypothetical protein [Comamonas thiooxydans]KGG82439.1 hypothetical protein P609_19640 [Comamonas thiooxydans]
MTTAQRFIVLLIALTVSGLVNVAAVWEILRLRDALTLARSDADQAADKESLARASADVCTQAVEALQLAGEGLKRERDQARAQAAAVAAGHKARADKILSTPAAVPGDACASAQARVAELLATRKSGGGQ